ncbi:hypothetical protein [Paracoccus sp. T5]|uniref:hypothetical protein n=1 Tax=Paracoccus sp. T5 TaxID=3402161 RepID=UPI003AEA6782
MAKSSADGDRSERVFNELCRFLGPLAAFGRSYHEVPCTGLRPRFNFCQTCLAAKGPKAPPEDWFQLGQCSSCGDTLLVCDHWLADLAISLGLCPTDGNGIPRLRQAFVHTPLLPHGQLLALLSHDIRRAAGTRTLEDD